VKNVLQITAQRFTTLPEEETGREKGGKGKSKSGGEVSRRNGDRDAVKCRNDFLLPYTAHMLHEKLKFLLGESIFDAGWTLAWREWVRGCESVNECITTHTRTANKHPRELVKRAGSSRSELYCLSSGQCDCNCLACWEATPCATPLLMRRRTEEVHSLTVPQYGNLSPFAPLLLHSFAA
jgi:hypothetical protein